MWCEMADEGRKEGGGETNSDVTQMSIPFTSSSMSISSSSSSSSPSACLGACPLTAPPVPFACLCASPTKLFKAGAAARSLECIESVAPAEWWYNTGGPEKKESGVWDWCVERGVNEEAVGGEWSTSIVATCCKCWCPEVWRVGDGN